MNRMSPGLASGQRTLGSQGDEEAGGDGPLQAWLCVRHFSPGPLAGAQCVGLLAKSVKAKRVVLINLCLNLLCSCWTQLRRQRNQPLMSNSLVFLTFFEVLGF